MHTAILHVVTDGPYVLCCNAVSACPSCSKTMPNLTGLHPHHCTRGYFPCGLMAGVGQQNQTFHIRFQRFQCSLETRPSTIGIHLISSLQLHKLANPNPRPRRPNRTWPQLDRNARTCTLLDFMLGRHFDVRSENGVEGPEQAAALAPMSK